MSPPPCTLQHVQSTTRAHSTPTPPSPCTLQHVQSTTRAHSTPTPPSPCTLQYLQSTTQTHSMPTPPLLRARGLLRLISRMKMTLPSIRPYFTTPTKLKLVLPSLSILLGPVMLINPSKPSAHVLLTSPK